MLYEAGERTRRFTPAPAWRKALLSAFALFHSGAVARAQYVTRTGAHARSLASSVAVCVPAGLCACVLLRAERPLLGAGGAARL